MAYASTGNAFDLLVGAGEQVAAPKKKKNNKPKPKAEENGNAAAHQAAAAPAAQRPAAASASVATAAAAAAQGGVVDVGEASAILERAAREAKSAGDKARLWKDWIKQARAGDRRETRVSHLSWGPLGEEHGGGRRAALHPRGLGVACAWVLTGWCCVWAAAGKGLWPGSCCCCCLAAGDSGVGGVPSPHADWLGAGCCCVAQATDKSGKGVKYEDKDGSSLDFKQVSQQGFGIGVGGAGQRLRSRASWSPWQGQGGAWCCRFADVPPLGTRRSGTHTPWQKSRLDVWRTGRLVCGGNARRCAACALGAQRGDHS